MDYNVDKTQDYLVLESISVDKPTSKSIFILTPNGTEGNIYRVGRANDQDLRIGDISSSRAHAQILFDGHKFSIKDNMSKFGTMVQIKNKLVMKPNQSRIIQVGRTILNVSVVPCKRQEIKQNLIMWQDSSAGINCVADIA